MIGEEKKGIDSDISIEYPSGDMTAFLSEMSHPRQAQQIDPDDGIDDLPSEDDAISEERDPVSLQMRQGAANKMGGLFVSVIDNVIPSIMGAIAKGDADDFRSDSESRADLEQALSDYMALKGADIDPGWMVLLLVCVIYGSKVPLMLQLRRLNEREALLQEREKLVAAREKALLTEKKES